MKKRILTGITTTGTPHIGNYLGAIKPALELAKDYDESFYFLADYHAIIKNSKSDEVSNSVKHVALAWLSSGLDPNKSFFYRQSDVHEILELSWILNCVTAKGLMNRSHAYKAATSINTDDEDKGITMGLFSYPVLMAADILMFNATHVPVGADQIQHIEMTRDIAGRFNHLYKKTFVLPEAIIQSSKETVPGLDGQKMSKSYGNIIPLLSTEKQLKKSISKIVTNSLEPGDPKDSSNCTVFALYKYFATKQMIDELKDDYKNGISWGDAKNKLFEVVNNTVRPIRESYETLLEDRDLINDLLSDGSNKVRPIAKELLDSIRSSVGINKISDIRTWTDKEMFIQFGDSGLRIAKLARAEDNRPVKSYKKRKSISSETTFNNDISSLDTLSNILWKVSLATSDRCKSLNLAGYTITLKLKTSNFKTITRRRTLPQVTQLADTIFNTCLTLLEGEAKDQKFRLIGVSLSNLSKPLGDHGILLDPMALKRGKAERVTDSIRSKYGRNSLIKGRQFKL